MSLTHSAYSLAASAFSSQDPQLYINGAGLSYGYRGYLGLGAAMQHPVSLTTGAATQGNGEVDGFTEQDRNFVHSDLSSCGTDRSLHPLPSSPSLHQSPFHPSICFLLSFMNHLTLLFRPSIRPSSGPTDLSMKSLSSANISNSSSSASANNSLGGRGGGGGGGASTQLSQPEITAVRQLIAGYRESAAFLLRSADELENLILQQN